MILFTSSLFTLKHLLFTSLSLLIINGLFFLNYKKDCDFIKKQLKYIGLFVIALEIIKILLNVYVFKIDNDINNIIPLYYCSLFIYFFIPTFFKNEKISRLGFLLLKYYGLVPGICFIFYPITAINYHPLFSFQSLHALIFHSLMVYTSLILLYKDQQIMNLKEFLLYILVTLSFCLIAYIVNSILKTNYMFINHPSDDNSILVWIYKITGFFYPLFIAFIQVFGSLFITILIEKLIIYRKEGVKDVNI